MSESNEENLRILLRKVKPWGWNANLSIKDWVRFLENFELDVIEAQKLRPISQGYLQKTVEALGRNRLAQASDFLEEALRVSPFDWVILDQAAQILWKSSPPPQLPESFEQILFDRYQKLAPDPKKAKRILKDRGVILPGPWKKNLKKWRPFFLLLGLAVFSGALIGVLLYHFYPKPSPQVPSPLPRERRGISHYPLQTEADFYGQTILDIFPEADIVHIEGNISLPSGSWTEVEFQADLKDERQNTIASQNWQFAPNYIPAFPQGELPVSIPWILTPPGSSIHSLQYRIKLTGDKEKTEEGNDYPIRWETNRMAGTNITLKGNLRLNPDLNTSRLEGLLFLHNTGARPIKSLRGYLSLPIGEREEALRAPFEKSWSALLGPDEKSFIETQSLFNRPIDDFKPLENITIFIQEVLHP